MNKETHTNQENMKAQDRCENLQITLEEIRHMLEVIKHKQEDIEQAYAILSKGKSDILTHNMSMLETLINVTSDRVIRGLKESEQ